MSSRKVIKTCLIAGYIKRIVFYKISFYSEPDSYSEKKKKLN